MTPDMAESLFIFAAVVAVSLGFFLFVDVVIRALEGLGRRHVRPVAAPRLIMPERYAGCLTCEAIESMRSPQRMYQHQRDDHGAVLW